MLIYPAVDIKNGKCVRLVQGKYNDMTVYSDDPVDMALKWESLGAEYLHVVDLDGARTGKPENIETIRKITDKLSIPVQMGGGIRTVEMADTLLDCGVRRVILGTSAVKNPQMVKQLIDKYNKNIAVGIDARDGKVAVEGWEETSEFTAIAFAKEMKGLGVNTIIYTDISRDGMLSGPNLTAMRDMVKATDMDVIASGGVGSVEDIRDLKTTGVSGVIVGKALYTGNVDMRTALEAASD